jgi:hypothetical protein
MKWYRLDLIETLDFFPSSVASLDESCIKNEQNHICRSKVVMFHKFHSLQISVRPVSMIASPSEEEVQSFHEVQRDFEGTILR